jgi:hypothetical protein
MPPGAVGGGWGRGKRKRYTRLWRSLSVSSRLMGNDQSPGEREIRSAFGAYFHANRLSRIPIQDYERPTAHPSLQLGAPPNDASNRDVTGRRVVAERLADEPPQQRAQVAHAGYVAEGFG